MANITTKEMCLVSKFPHPKTAQGDIVCYKVLIETDGKYKTPYIKCPVNSLPCELEGMGDKENHIIDPLDSNKRYCIGSGYVHSFSDLTAAVAEMEENNVLCSAIIPKGTLYYEGFNGCDYTSEKLHIGEIVSRYDDYMGENAPLYRDDKKTYTVGEVREFLEECQVAETTSKERFVVRPYRNRVLFETGARCPLKSYGNVRLYRNWLFAVGKGWGISLDGVRCLMNMNSGTALLFRI